jgi:mRNA interferase MazF
VKRGDLVTIALQGDFGKPRPALVIQSDFFDAHPSVTVLPVTSDLRETPLFRVTLEPGAANGLQKPSQVMVDKAVTMARERIGEPFGHLDAETMLTVERCLAVFLGIAK